jgi:hypothetical protein
MILTIDIPESLVEEAKARGISVEALVREKIEMGPDASVCVSPTAKRFGVGTKTPDEAVASILEMRKKYTLNDVECDAAHDSEMAPMTPTEAGAGMREMRKRYTLGGTVTIKQLIEEGRRY